MFVDHTVFYDIWSLNVSKTTDAIINWVSYRSPTAHFCFTTLPNRPFLLHRPPRVSHRCQGGGNVHFGNHCSTLSLLVVVGYNVSLK